MHKFYFKQFILRNNQRFTKYLMELNVYCLSKV